MINKLGVTRVIGEPVEEVTFGDVIDKINELVDEVNKNG